MKSIAKEVLLPVVVVAVVFFMAIQGVLSIRRQINHELRGAWTIVKQSGHENYGYVTELGWGFVHAGFTNKASAEAAMKEARWHHRHPAKPEPKKSMWEPQ